MPSLIGRLSIFAIAIIGTIVPFGQQATAAVITFDGLSHFIGYPLNSYDEAGFTVAGPGSFVENFGSGNPLPDIATGWPGGFQQSRVVTVTTDGLFTFDGLDIRTSVGVVDYAIRGVLAGHDEFVPLIGSADVNWTHVLGNRGTLIDTLIITLTRETNFFAEIDNIGVSAVNEPTTLALLGFCLACLAATRSHHLRDRSAACAASADDSTLV